MSTLQRLLIFVSIIMTTFSIGASTNVTPIKSNDLLTFHAFTPSQNGTVVQWEPKSEYTQTLTVRGGAREYTHVLGKVITDQFFTVRYLFGKDIDEQGQFVMFPKDPGTIKTGENWKTSFRLPSSSWSCGTIEIDYDVEAKEGPEYEVVIDGQVKRVQTKHFQYRGEYTVVRCGGGKSFADVFYSPDLNEIVDKSSTYYDRSGNLFVDESTVRLTLRKIDTQNHRYSVGIKNLAPQNAVDRLKKTTTDTRAINALLRYGAMDFSVKAFAVSKDGAYGSRWANTISMEQAKQDAMESCKKKPMYKPENPCFIFMENHQVVHE